ncbi:MAG: hypothetical protein ACOCRK_06915 [bacterium]
MGKLLMKLRERTLLMNSKIIEDYDKLKRVIEDKPNIKISELKDLDLQMQIFFKNIYYKVLRQAASEWVSNQAHPVDVIFEDEEKIQCELCHQPIKNVCYIVNKINDKELIVGSECVKSFEMNLGKSVDKLLEEMLKTKRLTMLNKSCNNIEDIISNWEDKLEDFAILIPEHLERPYLELGEQIEKYYKEFIEKKNNKKYEHIINNIKKLFEKRSTLITNMEKYANKYRDDKHIVTRKMVKWLERNKDYKVIKWIKNNGKIDIRTAHRIGEDNYLKSLAMDLNKKLENKGIKNIKLLSNYNGRKGYVFYYKNNLKLFCSYSKFLLETSWLIFDESLSEDYELMKNNLLGNSIVHQDSYNKVINMLFNSIKKSQFSIYVFDEDFDQLFIYNKKVNKYFIIDQFSRFINENLKNIVETDNKMDVIKLIKIRNKKEYNKDDVQHLLEEKYSRDEISYLIGQYR